MKKFLTDEQDRMVVDAIRASESRTSAQVRVFISHAAADDAVTEAHRALQRLGMTETEHRNAVLVFVAPESRKFAIVGDRAAHEKLGEAVWRRLAAGLREGIAGGDHARAIARAVEDAGTELARHFPREPGGGNELPDEVVER